MALTPATLSQVGDLLQRAPVDVNAVAERFGLAIYAKPLAAGVSGMIVRELGTQAGYTIYVDSGEAAVRQRFTAAHEIGHYVLHRDHIGNGISDNYLLRSDRMSNWMEVQANAFAADLLMPYPLIEKLIAEGTSSLTGLAKRLQVSEIAMGIRLGHPT